MSEWKECKLGDVCEFQEGYVNPSQNFSEYFDGNIKWLRATDLNNGNVYNTSRTLTEKGFLSAGKSAKLFKPNTIGISKSGTIGRLGILKDYMCGNRAVINIAPSEKVNTQFIYYNLLNRQDQFEHLAVGSVQKNLYVPILAELKIKLPSLSTQNEIAKKLSALDDKIELNNQINRNLEEQAKAIFNSVYDKAVNQVPFTSIISIASGGTPKTSESSFWNGNIPFFTPKDVGFPFTLNTEKYITDEGLNNCNSRLYPTNTTFITARGTVGKLSLAAMPMAMNQSCFALVSERINPILIYMYAIRAVDSLKKKSNGAVFDAITIKDFETERVNKLSDEEIKSLSSVIEPIYNQIRLNTIENHRQSDLRDSLLPKLMSGDLGC